MLDEPYLAERDRSYAPEVTLGEGEYYVLGDNRAYSNDSRAWGAVPKENVRGKVWMVYWPAQGIQFLNILDKIPTSDRLAASVLNDWLQGIF